jgi:branched-chain amino acid transport system permease protein
MVILPGWGDTKDSWGDFAEKISIAKKLKVILLDIPGFGFSSKPEGTPDIYDYSLYIYKFLESLGIKRYILLGHSFGGKLAVIMSKNENSIEKLILVAPSGFENRFVYRIIGSLNGILKRIFSLVLPHAFFERVCTLLRSDDYTNAGDMSDIFKVVIDQNVADEAGLIKSDVLLVWGDKDRQLSVKITKKIRNILNACTVRIIWGGSHFPHIDNPEVFLNVVKEELK